jgi:peptidoglycan/xylan/chitin deacetylase (PgdA/CDA1 family)
MARTMTDPLVLCYHAVSERWPTGLAVTPAELERQMRYLVNRGFRGATFLDAVAGESDERIVAVTFDDAFRSVLEQAFPILSKYGLPGTVFVPTAHAGSGAPMSWPGIDRWVGTDHERHLTGLTWHELKRLSDAGWEIGSHTASHPRLTELDDAALAEELRSSREECELRLGRACLTIAYPYGATDARVAAAALAAGYVAGAAEDPLRGAPRTALHCSRVSVYRKDASWRFRLKISPAVRRIRGTGIWDAVDRLRGATARLSGR